MASDLPTWPLLRGRTASRLKSFSHQSGGIGAPCRLPGCARKVSRSTKPGPSRWFCDHKCADDFRTQQRALDAAIGELAAVYQSDGHPAPIRKRLRADLEWLIEVRQAYVTPRIWRREAPIDSNGSDEGAGHQEQPLPSAEDAFREEVRRAAMRPEPTDPCPTCQGSGDLKDLRSPPETDMRAKHQKTRDTYAEMADVLRRLHLLGDVSLLSVDAHRLLEKRAAEEERLLQRSLRRPPLEK